MALKPSLSFLRLGSPAAPHVLEVYLDYLCPYSAKISRSLAEHVVPHLEEGGKLSGRVQLILRLTPQPWHATSTLLHEAALAFGRLAPERFWPFSQALMDGQEPFFDRPAADKTVTEMRKELAKLAAPHLASSAQADELLELLTPKGSPNGGLGPVTDDVKYGIKLGRQNAIHVTPTALWDGLVDGAVSSSFGEAEWKQFFDERVAI